jgi:hypothetical protein
MILSSETPHNFKVFVILAIGLQFAYYEQGGISPLLDS